MPSPKRNIRQEAVGAGPQAWKGLGGPRTIRQGPGHLNTWAPQVERQPNGAGQNSRKPAAVHGQVRAGAGRVTGLATPPGRGRRGPSPAPPPRPALAWQRRATSPAGGHWPPGQGHPGDAADGQGRARGLGRLVTPADEAGPCLRRWAGRVLSAWPGPCRGTGRPHGRDGVPASPGQARKFPGLSTRGGPGQRFFWPGPKKIGPDQGHRPRGGRGPEDEEDQAHGGLPGPGQPSAGAHQDPGAGRDAVFTGRGKGPIFGPWPVPARRPGAARGRTAWDTSPCPSPGWARKRPMT
jgi:hypothetical protein